MAGEQRGEELPASLQGREGIDVDALMPSLDHATVNEAAHRPAVVSAFVELLQARRAALPTHHPG